MNNYPPKSRVIVGSSVCLFASQSALSRHEFSKKIPKGQGMTIVIPWNLSVFIIKGCFCFLLAAANLFLNVQCTVFILSSVQKSLHVYTAAQNLLLDSRAIYVI